jgi:head-tail adaptor
MARLSSTTYDCRLRIERPVPDESFDGAGSGTWEPVAEVWANVQDVKPSRGERLAEGLNVATRPARIRIRHRAGIDSSMRALIGHYVNGENDQREWVTDRTVQIITEPAELGRREAIEFMVESYRPAGNGA